ncbi:hypothetical protein EDC04DRAFT_2566484 [Pisolithus marmoratus]|nr:hypothetical protein EDC04DRAFT_2566484 [Pisolithus marmoratus]
MKDISSPGHSFSIPKASVPLSSRLHFNHSDEGLHGVAGAQKVILLLNSHRNGVTKMTLNHNSLGDDGVCQLFAYLSSSEGSKHRATVSEINLTRNGIGCKGLKVIAEYVRGNDVLRALWLTNNDFTPDPAALSCLANALNNSRLHLLSLTGNSGLGDAFVARFLPLLRSRSLQELHINTIGLTPRSAPAIATWITGGSTHGVCHLQTLKCSGNSLGVRGVSKILRAIERGNWALTKVEVYANQLPDTPPPSPPPLSPPSTSPSSSGQLSLARSLVASESDDAWNDCNRALHRLIMRNQYWKRRVEKEALDLLKYARPLLMRSKSSTSPSASSPPSHPSPSPPPTPTMGFPFFALPNELKLYILSLFAPTLSPTQRVHIYNYASDPATLPSLTQTLRRGIIKQCLVDPSCLSATIEGPNYGSGCPAGKCMGPNSLVCRKEEERAKFLEAVGCTAYEPELDDPAK